MVLITIVNGAYKPTYNWGASYSSYIYSYIFFFVAGMIGIRVDYVRVLWSQSTSSVAICRLYGCMGQDIWALNAPETRDGQVLWLVIYSLVYLPIWLGDVWCKCWSIFQAMSSVQRLGKESCSIGFGLIFPVKWTWSLTNGSMKES